MNLARFNDWAETDGAMLGEKAGFTLIELLVLAGTLTALVFLAVAGRAGTKSQGQSFQCLENTRRLMAANAMYQAENHDELPLMSHGGVQESPNRTWVTGWLDWSGTWSDNTNIAFLTQQRYASLALYLNQSASVYKCPADVYASAAQRLRGWKSRVRSVSANVYVGKGNAWASGTSGSPGGPNNLTIYRGAAKSSDLLIPGPSLTFVYMDEHPDSLNDGGLFPPNSATNVPDAPSTLHNGAVSVSFADGHSQMHRWKGSTMTKPRSNGGLLGVNFVSQNNFSFSRSDPDVFWYSYSSPRHTTRTVAD